MDSEQNGKPSEELEVKPQAKLPFWLTRIGSIEEELESAERLQEKLKLLSRCMEYGFAIN